MKTKTIISNGTISVDIDFSAPKIATYKKAVEAGIELSKTCFYDLFNGRIAKSKGFELRVIQIEEPKPIVIDKPKAVTGNKPKSIKGFDSVQALMGLEFDDMVIKVPAVRQTYGSLKLNNGRLQITPIKNGTFGVLYYQGKGTNVETKLSGFDVEYNVGAKYTTMKRVNLETLQQLAKSL